MTNFCDAMVALVASDRCDLTWRQTGILLLVHHNATDATPLSVRDLHPALNMSKPAVTRSVDRLRELGLAKRRQSKSDGRLVDLRLTPEGTALAVEMEGMWPDAGPRGMQTFCEAVVYLVTSAEGRDLTWRQTGTLLLVYQSKVDPSVRDIAATLNVSKPAISRAIDRLETDDLAFRGEHARDKRMIRVMLTDAGREFAGRIEGTWPTPKRARRQEPVLGS